MDAEDAYEEIVERGGRVSGAMRAFRPSSATPTLIRISWA
jgi:hypothetical protein